MLFTQYMLLGLLAFSVSEVLSSTCVTNEANSHDVVPSHDRPRKLNRALRSLLRRFCPWLDDATKGRACCGEYILHMLNNRIEMIEPILKPCSECYIRYVDTLCQMMCGTDQSNFLSIIGSLEHSYSSDLPQMVNEVQVTLSSKWVLETLSVCSKTDIPSLASINGDDDSIRLLTWLDNLWHKAPVKSPYKVTYKVVANGLESIINYRSTYIEIRQELSLNQHHTVDPLLLYSYPYGTLAFYLYIYGTALTVLLLFFYVTEDPTGKQFREPKSSRLSSFQNFGDRYHRFQRQYIFWWSVASNSPWLTIFVSCCIVALLSTGMTSYHATQLDDIQNWSSKFSRLRRERKEVYDNFVSLSHQHVIYVAMRNATTWSNGWMIEYLSDFIDNVLDLVSLNRQNLFHICLQLPQKQHCFRQSYIGYFDSHASRDINLVPRCMDDPSSLECLPISGIPMTRYDVAAGFEGSHNFKIAILRFYTTNAMSDMPSYLDQLDWEQKFEAYCRLKKDEMAVNGTRLYFRAHHNEHYLTTLPNHYELVRPLLITCFALQFVYMVCVFQKGRIILPLAIVCMNAASVVSTFGALSLVGYSATQNLMDILPCIVLAIGADNMIILVLSENFAHEKPSEVSNVSFLRSVLWEVVPATRCNNISLLACSVFGFFTENAQSAVLAMYLTVTFSINFMLEETCFMAILLLESRCHTSTNDCYPFSPCKLPWDIFDNRKYLDHFAKQYYLPLLTAKVFQVIVIVVSLVMICFSLSLYYFVAIGEDMERFRSNDLDFREFRKFERNNIVIGHPLYFVVTGGLDFSDAYNRRLLTMYSGEPASIYNYLKDCGNSPKNSYIMVDGLSSWSDDFDTWLKTTDCCRIKQTDQTFCDPSVKNTNCIKCPTKTGIGLNTTSEKKLFYDYLRFYLNSVPSTNCTLGGHTKYYFYFQRSHIGTNFMIKANHIPLNTTSDHIRALSSARHISDEMTKRMKIHVSKRGLLSPEQVDAIRVFPYSSFHLFYDYDNFGVTTVVAVSVALFFVFLSHWLCSSLSVHGSLVVVLNTILVCAPLVSVMYYWNVAGTTSSLSFVKICVGVSVRFCTIVSNAFENSIRRRRGDRRMQAVLSTSRQVWFGVIGTKIFGLVPLAFVSEREYFRLFTGICISGCLSAAFVVPTLIYVMGTTVNVAKVQLRATKARQSMRVRLV